MDDKKALAEIYRALKPGGVALIMLPVIEGWATTYENPKVKTPETKQEVILAEETLIAQLNARVGRGELKNKAGQPVSEKLDGGLIRADRKILYPIREDIPVMLIEEGIPLENLS